jgi:malate dehydrogenase (oxaloacetate-decarboxylating)
MRINQNFKECDGYIETSLTGKNLMTTPQLNKGTGFTQEELVI